jgi:hypothetical protein
VSEERPQFDGQPSSVGPSGTANQDPVDDHDGGAACARALGGNFGCTSARALNLGHHTDLAEGNDLPSIAVQRRAERGRGVRAFT